MRRGLYLAIELTVSIDAYAQAHPLRQASAG